MKKVEEFFGGRLFNHQSTCYSVLEITLEYLTNSSDYVDESDKWNLETLVVIARSHVEYLSFFQRVVELMSRQCDMPAATNDLRIILSPVYRLSFYLDEKSWEKRTPWDHDFVKFDNKFFKKVHKLKRLDE
jgi:hypothetical protein